MQPAGIEVMDRSLLELARSSDPHLAAKIPAAIDNVLLVEFDAEEAAEGMDLAQRARRYLTQLAHCREAHLAVSSEEKRRFWAIRKAAVPILYRLKGERKILALIEDAVVPTDQLVAYFRGIYAILGRYGVRFVTFGHIAKGLLHTRPLLNLKDGKDVGLLKTLADEIYDLVAALGGTVSGEHGDGRLRSAYVKRRYPKLYPLMRRTKDLLDPLHCFNPEIKIHHDPDQMTRYLRYGSSYRAIDASEEILNWPEGLVTEIEKCHGCSKCTTVTTATRMCPVYKFTRKETAAPKAKANLLRGLISGKLPPSIQYERQFQAVMELCVMCGSCQHECPSRVNIPKLAAEVKARYVKRFGVSLQQRVLTSLEMTGRLTRKLTPMTGFLTRQPLVRSALQRLTGLSAQRDIPLVATQSLFERIPRCQGQGDLSALYFAGCYSGYVQPEIGEAVVRVLNHLGIQVHLPPQHCCGLPMLAKGMAAAAQRKVASNLNQWQSLLHSVDYIVVCCSSCGYALMRDWQDLSSHHAIAAIQAKVIHISHLIERYQQRLCLRPINATAAYHQPCHLKIQPQADSSLKLLNQLPGLHLTDLKSHCCGMIGSWGMTAANIDLSRSIGTMMIQRLKRSGVDLGVTDCPTCRMQMEQSSQTPVHHPVELVAQRLIC